MLSPPVSEMRTSGLSSSDSESDSSICSVKTQIFLCKRSQNVSKNTFISKEKSPVRGGEMTHKSHSTEYHTKDKTMCNKCTGIINGETTYSGVHGRFKYSRCLDYCCNFEREKRNNHENRTVRNWLLCSNYETKKSRRQDCISTRTSTCKVTRLEANRLATNIRNFQTWLRKREDVLSSLVGNFDFVKRRIHLKDLQTEAGEKQRSVDVLLHHGRRLLEYNWDIVLSVDLANLAHQWKVYFDRLQDLDKRKEELLSSEDKKRCIHRVPAASWEVSSLKEKYGDSECKQSSPWRFYLYGYINSVRGHRSQHAPCQVSVKEHCLGDSTEHHNKQTTLRQYGRLSKLNLNLPTFFNSVQRFATGTDTMSQVNKTWSLSKENLLMQHLSGLERSSSREATSTPLHGSTCSINLDESFIDLPTEPKRRRLTADDLNTSAISSQVSSQVSSRSHSPSLSESLFDDSLMSTPSASPTGTLKEHFRRKYRKDELWASIETNYKYLMDKGIIEACQTTESEGEEVSVISNVSFGEFLKQYKELTDWLKTIQQQVTQQRASSLALSEKYLNQSFHEEMIQRSPRLQLFNDYAYHLKIRHPMLKDEVEVFLKEVNTQWEVMEKIVAPANPNQDPETMLRDLEDDLVCLRKWLDGIEDHLQSQALKDWELDEIEGALREHKGLQGDIESHSRIVSAVLKLSERLQNDSTAFSDCDDCDTLELSAHNLERRWHGIWLQSLEWQCRLEDAISRRKGIFNSGPYLDPHRFSTLKEFTDDDEYDDLHNITASSGDDSLNGLTYRGDFIQSPPKSDSSASLSPTDSGNRSGKDSAVVSETELKSSDMSENSGDLSVSAGSDSDRSEFVRYLKVKKHDSRDIGYGSESQSDELDSRSRGITFSGIGARSRNGATQSGGFYTMVTVDTESTDKTDQEDQGQGQIKEQPPFEEVDNATKLQQVMDQAEMEKEDIRFLIDQADIMVQQGNSFASSKLSPQSPKFKNAVSDVATKVDSTDESSLKSSSSEAGAEKMDKGVGTIESSCDASGEESGDSDAPVEECSVATDDGADTFDSVVGSEYTSDEMKNGAHDYTLLPKLYDTNNLWTKVKGGNMKPRERPWSVVELTNVAETDIKPLSTSESAIDRIVSGHYSDSDVTTHVSSMSQTPSPSSRRRTRRAQPVQRAYSTSESFSSRSQIVGAKRKLNLSSTPTISDISGNFNTVPSAGIYSSTEDDEKTQIPTGNDIMHALQSARFKSSGSSYDDSDNAGAFDTQQSDVVVSECDDQNDAGTFSENAWDNYQAPLYTTGSEDPVEEPLTWEPMDEMEFDDEFSLPHATVIATLIDRRSEQERHPKNAPKLVPSNQGNFDDSDSDIEDLHHVLEESRMQLKVADRSLKKKRKDPLGTGLYLNPGKYGELLATIETNIKCLDTINQHLDSADFDEEDIMTIGDLLYQWEKLKALASEKRNQSQELKTMYSMLQTVQSVVAEGVPLLEKTKFPSQEELRKTMLGIVDKKSFLQQQHKLLQDLMAAVQTFASQNATVNMDTIFQQINDAGSKLEYLQKSCVGRLGELEHIQSVWTEYKDTRKDLEFLLQQERELLERLAFSQEMEMDGYKASVEQDIKKLVNSLATYEEKLVALQRLRSELMEVSDEETQFDITAGIADIRNQLFVAQQQCRNLMSSAHSAGSRNEVEEMEIDEAEVQIQPVERQEATPTQEVKSRRVLNTKKVHTDPKSRRQKPKAIPTWMKSFPIQAIALAVFLGLIYLAAPESLQKLLNFSLTFTPELKYVNGAPPM